jgi:microcystin-dependent protein
MPRDSQGNYSLPGGTIVATGDVILPSQHNPAMQDIAASITNSLSRDGNGGMRANLNMGGFRVTGMVDAVQPTDAVNLAQAQSIAPTGVPIGVIFDYASGNELPAGYLICNGQAVSRTEYPGLFQAISTYYGAGDGSTTFNVPDLRGRVTAGRDSDTSGRLSLFGGSILGQGMGNQVHTLTSGEMPSHSHGVNDPGHTHGVERFVTGSGLDNGTNQNRMIGGQTAASQTFISIQNAGGGGAHANVQPTIIMNKIIKARNF